MNSETWLFEDDDNNRHLVFIPAADCSADWAKVRNDALALLAAQNRLGKYKTARVIQHWEFYLHEKMPYSAVFILLEQLKALHLKPLQLNIVLMYRQGFTFEDVRSALGLKPDRLKKHNKQIIRKTGIKLMKNFA